MAASERPGPFGRIFAPNQKWLAKAEPEEILEPDLAIIDPHHHFWDGKRHRYLLHEFLGDTSTGHNVEATVFIECQSMFRADGPEDLRAVGEVEFVAGIAAMCESGGYGPIRAGAGIVGLADLALGAAVDPILEAMQVAGGGRFRGIRHGAGWDADPIIGNNHAAPGFGLYLQDNFRAGLACLTARNLALDALCFHPQLGDVTDLARSAPEANIILNHTGMPLGYGPYAGKSDEVHAKWLASMTKLASCPNVVVKLGGMMMRLASFDYHNAPRPLTSAELADHWRPYIEPTIELFGPERCMFESNFPVDGMGIGYAALWNCFKRLASGASAAEKTALFAGTARRAYRLT